MSALRINNSRSKKEVFILGAVFAACGIFAFGTIVPTLSLTFVMQIVVFVVALILWLSILALVVRKTYKGKGSLFVNTENKTFSLNGETFMPYDSLNRFTFSLVGNGKYIRSGPYSSMYINLGTQDLVCKLNDDDASKNLDDAQISALQELVLGSSLSEKQVESFNGWLVRLNIKRKA